MQVEGMKHSHKLEVTNVKLECVRGKGELERERDALHSQVDGTDLSQSLFPHFISLSFSCFGLSVYPSCTLFSLYVLI